MPLQTEALVGPSRLYVEQCLAHSRCWVTVVASPLLRGILEGRPWAEWGRGVYGVDLSPLGNYIFKIAFLILWANACGKWVNSIMAAEKHRIQETELETGNGKILRVPGDHLDKPRSLLIQKGKLSPRASKNLPSHMGRW